MPREIKPHALRIAPYVPRQVAHQPSRPRPVDEFVSTTEQQQTKRRCLLAPMPRPESECIGHPVELERGSSNASYVEKTNHKEVSPHASDT